MGLSARLLIAVLASASPGWAANNGYAVVGQQVANNTQVQGQNGIIGGAGSSPANATRLESRVQMTLANQSVSDIRFTFPTFYLTPNYVRAPNPFTLTAALEYAGVTTPLTFQGASSLLLGSSSGLTISDPVNPGIRAGGTFFVRTGITLTAGFQIMVGFQPLTTVVEGVLSTNATSQVNNTGDLVLGASGVANWGYGPMFTLGRTNPVRPAAFILGDSIVDTPQDANGNQGFITWGLQATTNPVPYTRISHGAVALYMVTPSAAPALFVTPNFTTHLICELAVNDLSAANVDPTTLPDIEANALSIYAAAKANGLKVYQTLITPHTSSTDNWMTASNQTPVARFGVGQDRDTFNAWIKARVSDATIDGFIDVNSIVEDPVNPGKWLTNGTPNYPTADGLHPSQTLKLQLAPLITTLANTW